MDDQSFVDEYKRELRRIGLDEDRSPYGGMVSNSDENVARFLGHLRALPTGATWRDVFPDIPEHWDLDDEETWTHAYRPLGSFDYPSLPCGPAALLSFPLASTDEALEQLSAEASQEVWAVYGCGCVPIENPDWPDRLAYVVLDVATTEDQFSAFLQWVEQRSGVEVAVISRPVGTRFAPEQGT